MLWTSATDNQSGEELGKDDALSARGMHGPLARPLRTATDTSFRPWQVILILAAFALLLIGRLPGPWVHGRFQDEEATVFLAFAWHFPWAEALWRPFGGYWNLAANATTLLLARAVQAEIIPLEQAPYITMAVGLAMQLLAPILLLTGTARWLEGRVGRLVTVAALAIAPAIEEVFFNVMHIQFQLALCTALIVALDVPQRRGVARLYAALLFIAPLCGPGAILILPLLALRTLAERDRRRLVQLVALGLGAAIQLVFFYADSPIRNANPALTAVPAAMAMRFIVLPFAGAKASYALAPLAVSRPMLTLALDGIMVVFVVIIARHAWQRRDGSLWLLGAALLMLGATLGKGFAAPTPSAIFYVYAGSRYNLIPLSLLATLLVAGWQHGTEVGQRRGYAIVLTIFLSVGIFGFPQPLEIMAHGPDWRREVAVWKHDPAHLLAVWPAPLAADLSNTARRCTPPVPPGDPTQPRYCENGWLVPLYANQRR